MGRFGPLLLASLLSTSCQRDDPDQSTYTLYRSSIVSDAMRVHVATFNGYDDEAYNLENCQLAADLFQAQPGIATKFWCEKGGFRE